jgi:hypothetical protein
MSRASLRARRAAKQPMGSGDVRFPLPLVDGEQGGPLVRLALCI